MHMWLAWEGQLGFLRHISFSGKHDCEEIPPPRTAGALAQGKHPQGVKGKGATPAGNRQRMGTLEGGGWRGSEETAHLLHSSILEVILGEPQSLSYYLNSLSQEKI